MSLPPGPHYQGLSNTGDRKMKLLFIYKQKLETENRNKVTNQLHEAPLEHPRLSAITCNLIATGRHLAVFNARFSFI